MNCDIILMIIHDSYLVIVIISIRHQGIGNLTSKTPTVTFYLSDTQSDNHTDKHYHIYIKIYVSIIYIVYALHIYIHTYGNGMSKTDKNGVYIVCMYRGRCAPDLARGCWRQCWPTSLTAPVCTIPPPHHQYTDVRCITGYQLVYVIWSLWWSKGQCPITICQPSHEKPKIVKN